MVSLLKATAFCASTERGRQRASVHIGMFQLRKGGYADVSPLAGNLRVPPPKSWQVLPILITIGIVLGERRYAESGASMKNVQIIDGAINAAYNIYAVSDDDFEIIFPNGQDIEFAEDFFKRVGSKAAKKIQERLNRGLQNKTEINGIHGTLFYGLKWQKKRLYPNKKFSDDPAPAF
ncbi:hypothetical protein [Mesorhizobium sp.]|uniref:hypothetical protein n=1 Tax=Mesorhizobium sp. TaxID=1871066 RepID=UPI0025BABD24|nr:hypothetical protein [Mesorhizobium sp.]